MSTKRDAGPSDSDSIVKKPQLNDHEEDDTSDTEVNEWPFQTSVTIFRMKNPTGRQHDDFPVNPGLITMVTLLLGTDNPAQECGFRYLLVNGQTLC